MDIAIQGVGVSLDIMKDDIQTIRKRAETPTKGIYQNHICTTCDGERALIMNALIESGVLESVVEEHNNPSPPSDLFPKEKNLK